MKGLKVIRGKVVLLMLLFIIPIEGLTHGNAEYLFNQAEQLIDQAFVEADTMKYLEAIASLRTIVEKFPESDKAPEAYLRIASIYSNSLLGIGNYKKAVEACKEMLNKYPEHEIACKIRDFLSHIYCICLYDYANTLKESEIILVVCGNKLDKHQKLIVQNQITYAYQRLGENDKKIKELEKLLNEYKDKSEIKEDLEQRIRWAKALGKEWKVHESEHLIIYYRCNSPAERDIKKIVSQHEKAYKKICTLLDVTVPIKIEYFFFSSQEEAEEWMWPGIVLNSSNRALQVFALYSDEIRASVEHELTHCIAYMINHHSTRARLELLSEGLAEAMVGERQGQPIHSLVGSLLKDKEISIRDLTDNRAFHQLEDSYPIAGSFVKYLLDEYGIEKFKFVYKYTHPKHIYLQLNLIFKKAYGKKLDELEKEWREYLGISKE